jgi:hypothetical protein
MESD